ncbi:hypothetical protein QVN85_03055 [Oscillibacter valericigenes]|nr:hypothetical protein [Oscillibacter valericigenes]
MSKSKDFDHIDDMLEWENKQYTPWEYAQEGKLPPVLKATGNPRLVAILFLCQGCICVLLLALMILNSSNLAADWTELLIPAAYAVICFLVAVNNLKKWKVKKFRENNQAHRKKRK